MPTISEMDYGFDVSGMNNYLSDLKDNHIEKAKEAILDISEIKTACESSWEGDARNAFLSNLAKDAQHVCNQLDEAYKILEFEIKSVAAVMLEKDRTMITIDE